jgi:hypothetical protein
MERSILAKASTTNIIILICKEVITNMAKKISYLK